MHCPAPKHELFSSKLDLTALAGQVQISMFQMKSPHLIEAYRKIKKKGGARGATGGERTTNGRMRHISWLGASHLISSHLLNRIFQGLCVPRRERLRSRCTWSPICCASPAVADGRRLGARWKGPVLPIAAWALLLANSSTGSKGPSTHAAGEILPEQACGPFGHGSEKSRAGIAVPMHVSVRWLPQHHEWSLPAARISEEILSKDVSEPCLLSVRCSLWPLSLGK